MERIALSFLQFLLLLIKYAVKENIMELGLRANKWYISNNNYYQ